MKVTAITAQVKTPDRYSVFVEGEYSFGLSGAALLESKLVTGQEITLDDIARFKKLSADDKAYSLTLAYVARRMRSEGELRDYFRRKAYEPELAEQLLSRLAKAGFVDDYDFATRWVENRRLLKATSTKKLRVELKQKRIADDIIRRVLAEDDSDELSVLREVAAKKRTQSRYKDPQKLIAYLARQGFSYDDIKTALTEPPD